MKEIKDSEKRKEIDNEVIKLYRQNYNSAQIRRILLKKYNGIGESVPTIINRLKKEGKISEKGPDNKELEKEEDKEFNELKIEVKEMYEDGIAKTIMREKLNKKIYTIKDILKELEAEGKLAEEKAKRAREAKKEENKIRENKIREELKKRIKKAKEAGMYNREIVDEEGVSEGTVYKILKELREEGNLDEEKVKRAKEARKNQELAEQRKQDEEKTEKKPIKEAVERAEGDKEISQYLKKLIEEMNEERTKKEDTPQQESTVKEKDKIDEYKIAKREEKAVIHSKIKKRVKIGKSYILACKKNSKENDEKQDTAKLRQSIELDYDKVTMNDIIFVINVHLKQHEYQNAIVFLNSLISFEEMKQIDKYYLKEMKKQIEHMREVNKVRQLLRKGLSKQDIESQVKLTGFEINKIANQVRNEQQAKSLEEKQAVGNEDIRDSSR